MFLLIYLVVIVTDWLIIIDGTQLIELKLLENVLDLYQVVRYLLLLLHDSIINANNININDYIFKVY
jgi:hypothetical protein